MELFQIKDAVILFGVSEIMGVQNLYNTTTPWVYAFFCIHPRR